ncbi:elongation factor G [Deinococcus maricopensis]|uniref:Small GTP-binding protein n=1 Tax=Deinococcus maricopensis (strain DSM 21211 / LMG 22137 / NRRL B-23946 / LB-34) TaxID=709986 RepID=E8U685_DEIML|nr:elongation factor G [Deinococcus maricopensis]ADV66574.1 small GTP-binding protein [Deinococcus maricopensis DSM 21211]
MPVRNVSIAAHSGVGKTTLTEALLHTSGAVSRMGRVEDGSTVSDHTDAEKAHAFSVSTGVVTLNHGGTTLTLLDTPGFADFVREIRGGIRAADATLIVVSAVSGVEVGTERVWATADRFNMPRLIAVNMMDRDRADFYAVLADIRATLQGPSVATHLPIGSGGTFTGIVDLLTRRAHTPDGESAAPASMTELIEEYRAPLIDAIVETDDALVERYLNEEAISDDDLHAAYLRAVHAGTLYPVMPISAAREIGIRPLLNALITGVRSARERGPLMGTDGQTREPTPDAPFSARVWRTVMDPYVGRIAYIRVWSGTLKPGQALRNTTHGADLKPAHLYTLHGNALTEVPELTAGMIGALTKLGDLHTGDTLADPAHPITYDPLVLPDPVVTRAIHPYSRQDDDKLTPALTKLLEEDPTLHFQRHPETGDLLLSGMGELHLDIAVEKLAALGVNVTTSTPRIPYRETIRAASAAQGKHKKQSGGHGQYGDVHLKIEPTTEPYEFTSAVVGGTIPTKYIPSIEKGVQDALARGTLAGYPVQNVKVTVTHGSHHDVDSSDIAFRTAGALAFRNAMQGARPALLEPVLQLRVRAPAQYTGDLISDLQTRRARVQGMDPEGTVITLTAVVPQSELQTYSADLRSLTAGRGAFSIKPHGYQEAPAHIVEKVIAQRQRETANA